MQNSNETESPRPTPNDRIEMGTNPRETFFNDSMQIGLERQLALPAPRKRFVWPQPFALAAYAAGIGMILGMVALRRRTPSVSN